MADLEFVIDDWTGSGTGSPEDVATRARLRIVASEVCMTRNDNHWSRSVSEHVHVSLYPLAMWIASNWWRLTTEPEFSGCHHDYDWRCAHELPAAAQGYLWPRLAFLPDGEVVVVRSLPTPPTSKQPITYLVSAVVRVGRREFESACTQLIDTVLARLDALGLPGSELASLWSEVRAERADVASTQGRRLEAMLRRDPDDADSSGVEALLNLARRAGFGAASELAGEMDNESVTSAVSSLLEVAQGNAGSRASRVLSDAGLDTCRVVARNLRRVPWKRGYDAARELRRSWVLDGEPISSVRIAEQLGADRASLFEAAPMRPLSWALAIRSGNEVRFLPKATRQVSRRFEVARQLGDLLAAGPEDRWHPVTSLRTARQQFQRAFAAELLCPAAGLSRLLGAGRSEEDLLAAADHFEVAESVVHHQIENQLEARQG